MLLPGVRLVETDDGMHFFDGRTLISLQVDASARTAVRLACTEQHRGHPDADPPESGSSDGAVHDAHHLLESLRLAVPDAAQAPLTALSRGDAGSDPGHDGRAAHAVAVGYAGTTAGPDVLPVDAARRLRTTTVHVLSDDPEPILAALASAGLRCAALPDLDRVAALDPEHDVVLVTDADDRPGVRLPAANRACHDAAISWLPVSGYDGASLHLGPLIVPGQTACHECTQRRRAANTSFADRFDDVVALAPAAPTPPLLRTWLHALAGLVLLQWIANRDPRIPGRLVSIDPARLSIRQAPVYRVPRCPGCAAGDYTAAAAPWEIARDH